MNEYLKYLIDESISLKETVEDCLFFFFCFSLNLAHSETLLLFFCPSTELPEIFLESPKSFVTLTNRTLYYIQKKNVANNINSDIWLFFFAIRIENR